MRFGTLDLPRIDLSAGVANVTLQIPRTVIETGNKHFFFDIPLFFDSLKNSLTFVLLFF